MTKPIIIEDIKRAGSNEKLFGSNKEINASNAADLGKALAQLLQSNAPLMDASDATKAEKREKAFASFQSAIAEHKSGASSKSLIEFAADMAEEIRDYVTRIGFMRNILAKVEAKQGGKPQYEIKQFKAESTGFTYNSYGQFATQVIQQARGYLEEFTIGGNVTASDLEIKQSSYDLLDQLYNQGLEAIMVGEDRKVKMILDSLVGKDYPLQLIPGSLTPQIYTNLKTLLDVSGKGDTRTVLTDAVVAGQFVNGNFGSIIDQVSQYEILKTGKIGVILGVSIMTDSFRNKPELRVLQPGEIYFLPEKEYLGAYSDRGDITVTPLGPEHTREATRGWNMYEHIGLLGHGTLVKAKLV